MMWRNRKTALKWTKGHNGSRGNKEADKLTGKGARKPYPPSPYKLEYPLSLATEGALIAKLEQKDFYWILTSGRRIPI